MGIPLTGCSIGVVASAPASHNETGFAALTYVAVPACDIVSIELGEKVWTDVTFDTLCPEGNVPLKGTPELSKDNIVLAFDKTNYSAARTIIKAAEASTSAKISVEVVLPDGTDRWYFEAQVFGFNLTAGGSGDFLKEALVMQRTKDGLVESFA